MFLDPDDAKNLYDLSFNEESIHTKFISLCEDELILIIGYAVTP
jgi:hypothetical protein